MQDFPELGQPWDADPAYRELTVVFGARGYVVRYRLMEDRVIIVRVWHGLEDRDT
ncbi:MAG: type II toxin-antitoxin system RelE/ParE family toxin [Pseudomonadota bacterium]